MKIERSFKVGNSEYKVEFTAENFAKFVETASLFDMLPTKGPNGETDLTLQVRHTAKGPYYSVVSVQADQEFSLGVSQKRPGELFPKGWQPIYKGQEEGTPAAVETVAPKAKVTFTQQVAKPTVQDVAPKAQVNPKTSDAVNAALKKFGI